MSNTLILHELWNTQNLEILINKLNQLQPDEIIIKGEITENVFCVIKIYAMQQNFLVKCNHENWQHSIYTPSPREPIPVFQYDLAEIKKIFEDNLIIKPLTKSQQIFWIDYFNRMFDLLFTQNIWVISALGFLMGILSVNETYEALAQYGAHFNTLPLWHSTTYKIISPMFVNFIISSRSCSAISASFKKIANDDESISLKLMNLPHVQLISHPFFVACILAYPLLNLISIISCQLGGVFMFMMLSRIGPLFVLHEIFRDMRLISIFDSTLRVFLSGICAGFIVSIIGFQKDKVSNADMLISTVSNTITAILISSSVVTVLYSMMRSMLIKGTL